ncbi:hypothetical protein A54_254 [Septuagintavirus sv54]|uniref:Lipoprotein n=1 Tax=Escherichia phage A5-4 TaxID=2996162 RepID=A0AAE9Q1T7_9CAUD|nr:hypothetical protein A54_254 [Escherichia phage A5-4]
MKRLIVLCILLLIGCKEGEDEHTKRYKNLPSLMPTEVKELHEFCKKQHNYYNSYAVVVDGEAKSVICKFKDSEREKGISSGYTWDAQSLRDKMKGVKNE